MVTDFGVIFISLWHHLSAPSLVDAGLPFWTAGHNAGMILGAHSLLADGVIVSAHNQAFWVFKS